MASTNQELLAKILVKIEACIDSPQVDYKIGDVTVSSSQYLSQLLQMKKELETTIPAEEHIVEMEHSINQFGVVETEEMA